MASLEELNLRPGQLRNVRLANYLSKRSSAFPRAWHLRYVVLSGNFLFVFSKPEDSKPRRVICIDECEVSATEEYAKKAFAFNVKTLAGHTYAFAAENAADLNKWITSINNASYTNMYQRTREAVKFLDKCKDLVVPFVVAMHASQDRGLDEVEAGIAADVKIVDEEDVQKVKPNITGGDVIVGIQQLRDAQQNALTALRDVKAEVASAEAEILTLRMKVQEEENYRMETASLRARAEELAMRNVELTTRVDLLTKDLAAASANSKQSRLLPGVKSAEEDNLRSRIRDLEAQLAREREENINRTAQQIVSTTFNRPRVQSPSVDVSSPKPGPLNTQVADQSALYEQEWAAALNEAQRLEREGAYAEAELRYLSVLDLKRSRLGPESVGVASSSRDLGRVLALQQKFTDAEAHYSRAVRLCQTLLGDAHPNTACALTDLAAVLREQGKFENAERYASLAVASLKAGVGADDVSTATALYNLAGLAKRLGKFREAENSYAEALAIFKNRLGDGEGETADTLYQMGCLFRKRNEVAKAAQYFQDAASAYSKTYGPDDKRVNEALKRARAMNDKIAVPA